MIKKKMLEENIKNENNRRKFNWVFSYLFIFIIFVSVISVVSFSAYAETPEVKFCCEKTKYGAWCQNALEQECDISNGLRKTPTSCEATSYCKLGCCYDSNEGVCMENTPQKVCDQSEGTWSNSKQCEIPQCNFGCCVIGTQAAYVTLTRCKKLSGFYGLLTDFRSSITNEVECISLASLQDEGACVFGLDYGSKSCKFTSRQECNSIKQGTKIGNESVGGKVTGNVSFYKDYLCSAEELGTNCGLTKETTCMEGKDEVYFLDSCGNPSNIYDASKINDKSYWRKKITKEEACQLNKGNPESSSCGNCNYLQGSVCKNYKNGNTKPIYGNFICKDLNCKSTSDGKKLHGESWCSTDKLTDSVGSRYIRHLCMNGEEIIEPCSDFRAEQCIQDNINGFSQAACRVNRWQDCYSQTEKKDCENNEKRDCKWTSNKEEIKTNPANSSSQSEIACVPLHPPGLKFWESGEAEGICSLANKQCTVTYEKTGLIFSGSEKAISGAECLTDAWKNTQLQKCGSLGDCGDKVNFLGIKGFDTGYKLTTEKVKVEENGG